MACPTLALVKFLTCFVSRNNKRSTEYKPTNGYVTKIAILGSGKGTTAQAIIEYAKSTKPHYQVEMVATTTPGAGIANVAATYSIPFELYTGENWAEKLVLDLHQRAIQVLVLAGFLRLLPESVISGMAGNVVNTHPALLPKHGGKGMYGKKVHEAVAASAETETGVTLHWVDGEYDKGQVIEQERVTVPLGATAQQIEYQVRQAELLWLPEALDRLVVTLEKKTSQQLF